MNPMSAWLRQNNACLYLRAWAEENALSLNHLWGKAPEAEWVVWLATRVGVADAATWRRFICFCARQNWNLLTDQRSRDDVELAERHIEGRATDDELLKVQDATLERIRAAQAAAIEAIKAGNSIAAHAADAVTAYAIATTLTSASIEAVAGIAAAIAADPSEARKAQMDWLHDNITFNIQLIDVPNLKG